MHLDWIHNFISLSISPRPPPSVLGCTSASWRWTGLPSHCGKRSVLGTRSQKNRKDKAVHGFSQAVVEAWESCCSVVILPKPPALFLQIKGNLWAWTGNLMLVSITLLSVLLRRELCSWLLASLNWAQTCGSHLLFCAYVKVFLVSVEGKGGL